jgi:hypothetical protein
VAIDLSDTRLEAAKHFGADVAVNNSREDALAEIKDLNGGLGADVAIEAVGVPASFELAVKLARPGGRIANIRVHGEAATLHLEEQWIRDITITTGLVDTSSTPTLPRLITTGQLDARPFVTHRFALDEFQEAYDVFAPSRRHRGTQGRPHLRVRAGMSTARRPGVIPRVSALADVRPGKSSRLPVGPAPGGTYGGQADQQVIRDQRDGQVHHDEDGHGVGGLAEVQDVDVRQP